MMQEDKELLLKDLCARLSYGIIINTGDEDLKLDRQHQGIGILYPEDCSDEFNKRNNNASFYITISGCYYGEEIKPYLRPMSSMTQDECTQLFMLLPKSYTVYPEEIHNVNKLIKILPEHIEIITDFYNSHYLDWRGLIPMSLALEAKEGMYNIK